MRFNNLTDTLQLNLTGESKLNFQKRVYKTVFFYLSPFIWPCFIWNIVPKQFQHGKNFYCWRIRKEFESFEHKKILFLAIMFYVQKIANSRKGPIGFGLFMISIFFCLLQCAEDAEKRKKKKELKKELEKMLKQAGTSVVWKLSIK